MIYRLGHGAVIAALLVAWQQQGQEGFASFPFLTLLNF